MVEKGASENSLMSGSKPLLIVVCGPTAIGKTTTAIRLANQFHCPILSFDSRQFYRELRIGNARPTEQELEQAEHHFIANRSIHEVYTAGMFETDALNRLDDLFQTNKYCIAVGGSGLYINALCHGIDAIPSDEKFREELENRWKNEGLEVLQKEVLQIDPHFYAAADMQNPRRVMRALEAYHLTGIPYSEQRKDAKKERPFQTIWIGLEIERELLFDRINLRVDEMMENGLLEEARALYPHRHLKSLKTVGYRELFDHFDGEYELEEAIRLIQRNSRRYAKQQVGWFRKNTDVHWFKPSETERMISLLRENFMP